MSGQREHGTRACYVFGPRLGRGRGCRCDACTAANREANRHRDRMIAYGRWQPFVEAEPVRQHLATLAAAGIGRRRVAELSGVSDSALRRLLGLLPGRPASRHIRPETAQAVLAIRPGLDSCAGGARVNPTGTRRRLQALAAVGWTQTVLAVQLGMTVGNFAAMLKRPAVSADTARRVAALYDELWSTPPPEADQRSRVSARRARRYATRRGWAPPMAWDDGAIDDPAATPAQGWQRTRRTLRTADLAADATELITSQGYTRRHAAGRLGVSPAALAKALDRARAAPSPTAQEGTPMFDPVPRSAPERLKGAAFAHEMVLRQVDAGEAADQIQARHTAAVATLTTAARTDAEGEFLEGFAATGQDHIDTLRDAQHADADQLRWERAQESEPGPEREAG